MHLQVEKAVICDLIIPLKKYLAGFSLIDQFEGFLELGIMEFMCNNRTDVESSKYKGIGLVPGFEDFSTKDAF